MATQDCFEKDFNLHDIDIDAISPPTTTPITKIAKMSKSELFNYAIELRRVIEEKDTQVEILQITNKLTKKRLRQRDQELLGFYKTLGKDLVEQQNSSKKKRKRIDSILSSSKTNK